MPETLGSEGFSWGKGLTLALSLILYAILFWASIGASPQDVQMCYFYIGLGMVLWTIPLAFDIKIKKDEYPLDTVSVEKPTIKWLTQRNQIIIGVVLAILLALQINSTRSVWILAPKFTIFTTSFGNGIISAICGIIETGAFFGTIYPIIHSISHKYFDGYIADGIGLVVGGILPFTMFHTWRYSYSAMAMGSVATYALKDSLIVFIARNQTINYILHGTNNFLFELWELGNKVFKVLF